MNVTKYERGIIGSDWQSLLQITIHCKRSVEHADIDLDLYWIYTHSQRSASRRNFPFEIRRSIDTQPKHYARKVGMTICVN